MTITKEELDEIIDLREKMNELCNDKVVGLSNLICIYSSGEGVDTFYKLAEELKAAVIEEKLNADYLSDYRVYFTYRDCEVGIYQSDFELMKRKEDHNAGISDQVQTQDIQ